MPIFLPKTGHSTGSEGAVTIEIGWLPRPAVPGRIRTDVKYSADIAHCTMENQSWNTDTRNIEWGHRWPIPVSASVEFLDQFEKILLPLLCLLFCLCAPQFFGSAGGAYPWLAGVAPA